MKKIENVAIIGMGALGLLYGNQIMDSMGESAVCFLLDEKRYEKYQEKHVTIQGVEKHFPMIRAQKASPADMVIVAVKYHGLPSALDTMQKAVGPDTVIMSVLNGITSEKIIGERYGMEHMVYTVAQGMDAMRFGDSLRYTKMGELRIGMPAGENRENLLAVKEFLEKSKIPYTLDEDILYRMWGKFMLNVGINQVCMAYETTYAGALREGEAHDMLIGAMEEVIRIANAEGIALSRKDMDYYIDILKTLAPDGVPSMRQDGIAKRKTEVDMFAGTVMEIAKKHGIPVPVNTEIYKRVKEMEKAFPVESAE